MKIKMYAIFSKESLARVKNKKGKIAAQAGHAFLHSYWNSKHDLNDDNADSYFNSNHAFKICCLVSTDEELEILYESYKGYVGTTKVVDSGFTVLKEPGLTCIGIGPIREDQIKEDLKGCKLF